jgi:hypothetical protein
MKRPRGNSRSKVLVENDMIRLVERMQLRDEDAKSAGEALGIPATTAQRLARKGLRRVLMAAAQEKIKAIADADSNPIPTMQGQFELPEPEPVQPEPPPQVILLPAVEPEPTPVTEPVPEEDDPWPWGHLMSYVEFKTRDPWRQKQLIAQWEENVALGGRWTPVLRGGPKNRNCFRGCPSYQCNCEENL